MEKTIKQIMDLIDWEKIHAYMKLTDWTWNMPGEEEFRVPTIEELKATGLKQLKYCADSLKDFDRYSSGGLEARKDTWGTTVYLQLSFCLQRIDCS